MSRPLRLEISGGIYHVTSRGDRREDIYECDEDRNEWLAILGKTCVRYNWKCHAYCLMGNHYHIVIETAEANLSTGMRHLNGVYTQYYNRHHDRVGHVFQGRFKGILVERDEYLLELARYVVLNPIRAKMTKNINSWEWSSYSTVIGKNQAQPWLDTDWILSCFSKQRKRAIERYVDFVRAGIGLPSIWGSLKNQIFLGTDKFVKRSQKEVDKKSSLDDIPRLQKRKIPESLEFYDNQFNSKEKAIVHAYLSGGYTLKELGIYYGKHYSTISRIIKNNE